IRRQNLFFDQRSQNNWNTNLPLQFSHDRAKRSLLGANTYQRPSELLFLDLNVPSWLLRLRTTGSFFVFRTFSLFFLLVFLGLTLLTARRLLTKAYRRTQKGPKAKEE